jgi:5-methylthioribose kinase
MRRVFDDALRFAGVAMIGAILGRQHVRDFEQIEDPARRAACERNALLLARELIKDAHYVSDIGEVMKVARELRHAGGFTP